MKSFRLVTHIEEHTNRKTQILLQKLFYFVLVTHTFLALNARVTYVYLLTVKFAM